MKIEYLRNMQSSFMRIVSETAFDRITSEILSYNQLEGIIPLCWQQEDQNYLFRYDITGKQGLDALLEKNMADEKLIIAILAGICAIEKQLEKHLLPLKYLVLRPETIFWDYKREMVYFCYFPKEQETFQESFLHFIEYLLTKTDHKNMVAVKLVYEVYEELLKPSYSFYEIQNQIQKNREEQSKEAEVVIEEEPKEEMETFNKHNILEWIKETFFKWIRKKQTVEEIVFEPEDEERKSGLPTVLLAEQKEAIVGTLKYEGFHSLPDISITKLPFLIGSASDCDGIVVAQTISRQHAKITQEGGVYFLEDLNSTNGTTVDGVLLSYKTRVSLRKNEMVCFADESYRFV